MSDVIRDVMSNPELVPLLLAHRALYESITSLEHTEDELWELSYRIAPRNSAQALELEWKHASLEEKRRMVQAREAAVEAARAPILEARRRREEAEKLLRAEEDLQLVAVERDLTTMKTWWRIAEQQAGSMPTTAPASAATMTTTSAAGDSLSSS